MVPESDLELGQLRLLEELEDLVGRGLERRAPREGGKSASGVIRFDGLISWRHGGGRVCLVRLAKRADVQGGASGKRSER